MRGPFGAGIKPLCGDAAIVAPPWLNDRRETLRRMTPKGEHEQREIAMLEFIERIGAGLNRLTLAAEGCPVPSSLCGSVGCDNTGESCAWAEVLEVYGQGPSAPLPAVHSVPMPSRAPASPEIGGLRDAEKACLIRVLDAFYWNRKKAAKYLGLSYRGLLYKLKRHGLVRSEMRDEAVVVAARSV